jgi:hypothetical protein
MQLAALRARGGSQSSALHGADLATVSSLVLEFS